MDGVFVWWQDCYTIYSRLMEITRKNKLINFLIKLGGYLLIFYVVFLLGRSIWINWQLKQSIKLLSDQIVLLKNEKKDLENLNLYYQSDSFKELEAREKLGLKKPGESVLILPATPSPKNFPQEVKKEQQSVNTQPTENQIPNWLLWWEFFTKKSE